MIRTGLSLLLAAMTFAPSASAQLTDPLEGTFRDTETSLEDQKDIAVTVYNNNLALVRDTRSISMFPGEAELRFMDVAQQIMPETVSIRSVSNPGAIRIIEQNYEYDLMSPQKLMEKYVGKQVRLVNFSTQIGFEEKEAELLSMNQGPVYQIGDEIFLGHPGSVSLPEVPDDLIAKPSLIWLLESRDTDQDVEATYLTRGISWRADYVITMDKNEEKADIDAWVTLDNQSGATYQNAKLKLVAGDVNQVTPVYPASSEMRRNGRMAMKSEMRQESFAEYHLYTLPRRTTIKQNQSKQVALFDASGVTMEKRYEFRGNTNFYAQKHTRFDPQHVEVFIEFENRENNQLGVPLPGGIMRIYQEDSEGMLQFAGEDRIEHTPKNERVALRMGTAFDVVAERVQTDFDRISDRVIECEFEISVRNHKETDVVVDVVEPMPADWQMQAETVRHVKKDAHTAVFRIPVAADGESILNYRVRVRY